MNEIYQPIIRQALSDAKSGKSPYRELRKLPLSLFGKLMVQPDAECPELTDYLPKITPVSIQKRYNGRANLDLLPSSVSFMESVNNAYTQIYEKKFSPEGRVLDYGFGWGRLIRMSYWLTEPGNVYGFDPQQASIDICNSCGITENLRLCDEIPSDLPVERHFFNLIYSFSVFTHISFKAANAILRLLRHFVVPDGLLVITIRPIEFWDHARRIGRNTDAEYDALTERHRREGYAYIPAKGWAPVDGEVQFGDCSMTLEFIRENWPEWNIAGNNLTLEDPFQLHVFLTPASA